jgi:hypothetical protein
MNRFLCLVISLIAAFQFRAATSASATTITVTSTADSGAGTLRAALASAGNGDIIDFSLPLPATITLTSGGGGLQINASVTITGPGAKNLAISGNSARRVFIVAANTIVNISGLTLRDGRETNTPARGGCILNFGTLGLSDCVLTNNCAASASTNSDRASMGGAIFNDPI